MRIAYWAMSHLLSIHPVRRCAPVTPLRRAGQAESTGRRQKISERESAWPGSRGARGGRAGRRLDVHRVRQHRLLEVSELIPFRGVRLGDAALVGGAGPQNVVAGFGSP